MWLRVKLLQLLFGRSQWVSPSEVVISVWKMGASHILVNEVVFVRATMLLSKEMGSSAKAGVDQPSVLACENDPASEDWVDKEYLLGATLRSIVQHAASETNVKLNHALTVQMATVMATGCRCL